MNVPAFQLCAAVGYSKELICKLMNDMRADQYKIDQIDTVIDSIVKSGVRLEDSEDLYDSFVEETDLDVLVIAEYSDYSSNSLKLSVTYRVENGENYHLCILNGIPTVIVYVNNRFRRRYTLSEECFVKIMLSSAMVYLVFTSFYPMFAEENDSVYLDLMENHFCCDEYLDEIISCRDRKIGSTKSAKSVRFTPY